MAAPSKQQMLVSAAAGRVSLIANPGFSVQPVCTAPLNFMMQIYVPPHPLVKHWLAVLRTKDTPSSIFRSAASGEAPRVAVPERNDRRITSISLHCPCAHTSGAELGRILVYEAAREWLPTVDGQVQTPLGIAEATFVDPMQPIKVSPSTLTPIYHACLS
jgi:uracil phosphoribosyltransferase